MITILNIFIIITALIIAFNPENPETAPFFIRFVKGVGYSFLSVIIAVGALATFGILCVIILILFLGLGWIATHMP